MVVLVVVVVGRARVLVLLGLEYCTRAVFCVGKNVGRVEYGVPVPAVLNLLDE